MSGPLGRQIQLTGGGLGICGAYLDGPVNCTVVDGAWSRSLDDVFSRGLFARSSHDVRHHCCATGDEPDP
jgi:hypothetical protein